MLNLLKENEQVIKKTWLFLEKHLYLCRRHQQ